MLKNRFQIQIDDQQKDLLMKGMTLDKHLPETFVKKKMDWRALKQMTQGDKLIQQLANASKKKYNSIDHEDPKSKLDMYF